jgi:AraC-like DNA-binding protein
MSTATVARHATPTGRWEVLTRAPHPALAAWVRRYQGYREWSARRAWTLLERSHGRFTVEALARELRCSRRHLAARFREQVGLPPLWSFGTYRPSAD